MNPYKPEAEIFPNPVCSCGTPWKKICPRCNIAFCWDHVPPEAHPCKPDEVRPYPRQGEKAPEKTVQTELFPPGTNGKAS